MYIAVTFDSEDLVDGKLGVHKSCVYDPDLDSNIDGSTSGGVADLLELVSYAHENSFSVYVISIDQHDMGHGNGMPRTECIFYEAG